MKRMENINPECQIGERKLLGKVSSKNNILWHTIK